MPKSIDPICGCHLVGSVPLESNEAVFRLGSETLGDYLRRMPDGETGERSHWIKWQFSILSHTPQLETIQLPPDRYGNIASQCRLKANYSADDVAFGALGYSAAALASYQVFAEQKARGYIASDCRFQVALPTPLAPIQFYVAPEHRAALEPVYEAQLMQELRDITDNIPHCELAIQWDTAVEFGILEGVFPSHLADAESDILQRLNRLGNAVPPDVELGYHLCYGDSGHKHFVEPKDTEHLVRIANGIASGLQRPLNWIHLPVPRDRTDSTFFAPLKNLQLDAATELYLGLVHATDGVHGTKKRIEAAQQAIESFGVATECGFGRRSPDTVDGLMQIHAQVASPVR